MNRNVTTSFDAFLERQFLSLSSASASTFFGTTFLNKPTYPSTIMDEFHIDCKDRQPKRNNSRGPSSRRSRSRNSSGPRKGNGDFFFSTRSRQRSERPPEVPDEDEEEEGDYVVTLQDYAGRPITCLVDSEVEIDGDSYVVLLPENEPVKILGWDSDDADAELVAIEDDQLLDELFPAAEASLKEVNLVLRRTGFVLTVEGEIPPLTEDDISDEDFDEAEEEESVQVVSSFVGPDGQEYDVCAPLEPLYLVARRDPRASDPLTGDDLDVLSPDELREISSTLNRTIEDAILDL